VHFVLEKTIMKKISIVLAIRSLDIGGAERQFLLLAKGIDKERFDVTVCTMYGGAMEDEVRAVEEIDYVNLQKKGRYDIVEFSSRYRRLLLEKRPDFIYSFLGEMNLFSLWCKPAETKLVWGFRASDMDLSRYDRMSRLLFWLQKRFSKKADRIVCNSNACIDYHKIRGFAMERAVTIPNGIDTERFRPDGTRREEFRRQWGLKKEDVAVGIVARLDTMKGYEIFAQRR
jgi:glycosyltransferase involved in cell wall biosynthesis